MAITGSTGKTSTKDILAALLAPAMPTAASPQNLNTEIGLPLAILAAPGGRARSCSRWRCAVPGRSPS